MKFETPLVRGTLERRYKRFLCDVVLDSGEAITGTCPNTGSMIGLKDPGTRVWLSESDNPKRKYPHTWELVELGRGRSKALVGVNTNHPNKLVAEAITNGMISELSGYETMKREQKYGKNSRIDLLLEDPADSGRPGRCYVEVKNVHMLRETGQAEFPDSVTERGTKHLYELSDMVAEGHRAVMVYLIQRTDAECLSIARDIDPTYGEALDAARANGVEALAYACSITPKQIKVNRAVPLID